METVEEEAPAAEESNAVPGQSQLAPPTRSQPAAAAEPVALIGTF